MDIKDTKHHRSIAASAALALATMTPAFIPDIDDVDIVSERGAPLEEMKRLNAEHKVKLKDGTILQLTPEQYAELELIYRRRRYENKGAKKTTVKPDFEQGQHVYIKCLSRYTEHKGRIDKIKPDGSIKLFTLNLRVGDDIDVTPARAEPPFTSQLYIVTSAWKQGARARLVHEDLA